MPWKCVVGGLFTLYLAVLWCAFLTWIGSCCAGVVKGMCAILRALWADVCACVCAGGIQDERHSYEKCQYGEFKKRVKMMDEIREGKGGRRSN